MSGKAIGGVRRVQMITTYGVGALIAVGGESFMVAGIDRWPDLDNRERLIHEPRLQGELRVTGFRLPPSSEYEQRGDVPVVRFPEWLSCPECQRLASAKSFGVGGRGPAICRKCDRELTPSRFVVCCSDGHIGDFPYFRWVHAGTTPGATREHNMAIVASGRSAALRDIAIECSCGLRATMENALGRAALAGIATCDGRRPWLEEDRKVDCQQPLRAMQRGASGVWFADVRSSIAIPPWSEGVQKVVSRHWKYLGRSRNPRHAIEDMDLIKGTPYTVDEMLEAVERRKSIEAGAAQVTPDLKQDEYSALRSTTPETGGEQDFACVPVDLPADSDLGVAQVMQVTRLREVRALTGFTRIEPPDRGDRAARRAPLSSDDHRPDWLPAVEVIGEGVFLRLDQHRVGEWERRSDVLSRVAPLNEAYARKFVVHNAVPDRQITPRLVLLHTLAHALINQWSLECGYPAAALRERLYATGTMAGILVYTASSDSAGSLGGIVDQVADGRLTLTVRSALRRASWCSADPVCIETSVGGTDNLNRAACHACVLLPETCCEEYNILLDRALLVGTTSNAAIGYFPVPSTA